MKNWKTILAANLALLATNVSFAALDGVVTSGSTPGVWTTDWEAAKKVAKANNIFYCVDFTKSSGCNFCVAADNNVYNQTAFRQWSVDNGVALVEADYNDKSSKVATYAFSNYLGGNTGFPMMSLISPDGNAQVRITGSSIRAGAVSKPTGTLYNTASLTSRDYPVDGYYLEKLSPEMWIDLMHYLLNRTDDTPSLAVRITPDAIDAADTVSHGLYGHYGTNGLFYRIMRSGSINFTKTQDTSDWYVFTNAEAGKTYKIEGSYEESEPNLGRIFVYSSLASANGGSAGVEAAEKSAFAQGYMNKLANGGFEFTTETSGDIYIQFATRAEKITPTYNSITNDEFSASYVFSLQEGRSQSYGFEKSNASVSARRSLHFATITLSRTNPKGAESVPYDLLGWGEGGMDATAFETLDYDYPQGDRVFAFADGEDTATIQIPVYDTIWDDTCHFYVAIDVGGSLNDEWQEMCRVDILDDTSLMASGVDDPATAVVFNSPSFLDGNKYAAGTRLLQGDVSDWFTMTNLPAGIVCSLTVAGDTNLWSGLSQLSVQAYANGGEAALAGKSLTIDAHGRGDILFVTETSGDYFFRVAPVKGSATGPLLAAYSLAMTARERPVVAFPQSAQSFDSPNEDVDVDVLVSATDGDWPYSPRPTVKTVAITAVDGTDYVGFGKDGVEVGEGGTVTLTLKDAGKWRPERAFKLVLEPDPEGFYVIGDVSELEITLSGDDATPSPPMDKDSPIAVGKAFAMAEGRNLSHTNTSDTLYFSVPAGNAILGADNLTIKPSGTEIGVVVYTNVTSGGIWVKCNETPWSLRDLADPDKMPLLRFAEAGTAKVVVSRDPDDEAMVCYSIGFTQWETPVVEFASGEWETPQSDGAPAYTIKRSGDTQLSATVYATLTCVTARDGVDIVAFTRLPVVIPAGESEATVTVTNLTAETPAVWKGDRVFKLSLEVDDARLSLGACSEATVTLISEIPEYEDGDTAGESQANPAVTTPFTAIGDAQAFTRRLNGADAGDWFTFTGAKAGQSYRFLFSTYLAAWTTNIEPKDVSISFALPGAAVVATNLAAVIDSECWNSPILSADGDIKVRVWRPGVADASVEYTVSAYEWPWPKMTFEKGEDEVSRDGAQTYSFLVRREDNLMLNDPDIVNYVKVSLEGDESKYVFAERTIAFAPGLAETNLTVELRCASSVWTGDESFTLRLAVETDETKEKIKTGEYASLVVAVKDSTPQYDAADNADHVATGATTLGDVDVRWNAVAAHLNGCEGRNTSETIGDDNVDWYKFTNLQRGKMYRFEARDVVTANIDADAVAVEFFFDPSGAAIAAMSLAELSASGYKTPKIADENAVYAKVSRAAAGTSPVYVAYEIAYKMQANRTVYFQETSVEANEAASVVVVNVVCETGGEKIDLSDVTATVAASEDPDAAHPALSPSDFYAGVVSRLAWPIETTGGVRRVKVPLANFDSVWEGDETFKLTLECDGDTELGANRTVVVTLKDKEDPECGMISLLRVGDPLSAASSSKTYAVREGEKFAVELGRVDGCAGAVTGVWTWASGSVEKVPLFADRGDGIVESTVTVPTVAGYQSVRHDTCVLSILGGASLAADSVATLNFAITDADFAGAVAAYSKDDLSRLSLRATGTGWYSSVRDGTVCSTGAYTLKTSVKGPGTLTLTASIPKGATLKAKVAGKEVSLTHGVNSIGIAAGAKAVSFTASAAGVEISDIVFMPSAEFRKTGTYTGWVQVGDVPGRATMTVAQNGKVSGKFACGGKSWTFSANGGWNGDVIEVVVRSGRDSVPVQFQIDASAGSVAIAGGGEPNVGGEMWRDCWSDSPVQPEEAAVLADYKGYYTATLPQECTGETFGSGYLLVTVGENGSVKATGVLADGQSVSMSSELLVCDGKPQLYLYFAPNAYRGGWFHALVSFAHRDDDSAAVLRASGADWVRYDSAGELQFSRMMRVSGGRYSKTGDLSEAYRAGLSVTNVVSVGDYSWRGVSYKATAWGGSAETPCLFDFNAAGTKLIAVGDSSSLLSINFTRSTGVFRGNEKIQYEVEGRSVIKSFTYKGVLTPVCDEDDNVGGRGFFLMDNKSYGIELSR